MKTRMNFFQRIFLLVLVAFWFNAVQAQDKKALIKSAIETRRFVFKVQSILPSSGSVRQTSGEYDIRVAGDSLISYLPYFGRAYSAPLPGEGGINFTSTKFSYSFRNAKKGGWEILIKPKDTNDLREFSLRVSEKGYGILQATSNNRQPISYNGYIDVVK